MYGAQALENSHFLFLATAEGLNVTGANKKRVPLQNTMAYTANSTHEGGSTKCVAKALAATVTAAELPAPECRQRESPWAKLHWPDQYPCTCKMEPAISDAVQ
ncbi:unnamed protein product [Polarella glacialis]|uniref:Uncharacterized protein n=1 Tax=Polarella glacialis TaxID=89957 RepID=A0A813IK57_POLGL|nr:unnamed protein product [Polarella glacialis]